ncbi:DUF6226 family protein [Cryobacterium sp. LW097]|uniref:DUF6226 family protein n=1 Tax=Cryobacterium sp. LW097 TaxID=1978566 RepID=UPI003513E4CC
MLEPVVAREPGATVPSAGASVSQPSALKPLGFEPRRRARKGSLDGENADDWRVTMSEYRHPTIPVGIYRDERGLFIDYGNRWGGESPPEDAYSRLSKLDRFALLHDVALALVAWRTVDRRSSIGRRGLLAGLCRRYSRGGTPLCRLPTWGGAEPFAHMRSRTLCRLRRRHPGLRSLLRDWRWSSMKEPWPSQVQSQRSTSRLGNTW